MEVSAQAELHHYAFDIKLNAVVRVVASDEQTARAAIERNLDAADLKATFKGKDATVVVTEASLHIDDADGPYLFEIDDEDVD
jgi:hypothetical protein